MNDNFNKNNYALDGVVEAINAPQTYGNNGFTKRTIIVNDNDSRFPQKLEFVFSGKNTALVEQYGIKVGDRVTLYFSVRSREYNGRIYTELQCWKVLRFEPEVQQTPKPAEDATGLYSKEVMDNLPF